MLGVGKYLPHTHSQVIPTLKQGSVETVVGAEGGAAEIGLGRQKIEKGKEEQEDQLGNSSTESKRQPKRSAIPFEQLRHLEMLLKE